MEVPSAASSVHPAALPLPSQRRVVKIGNLGYVNMRNVTYVEIAKAKSDPGMYQLVFNLIDNRTSKWVTYTITPAELSAIRADLDRM